MKSLFVMLKPVERKAGIGVYLVWVWQVVRDSGTHLLPGELLAAGESSSADTAMAEASVHVIRLATTPAGELE